MAQSIININTVKSFVQEKREIDEFAKVRKSIKNNFFNGGLYSKLLKLQKVEHVG